MRLLLLLTSCLCLAVFIDSSLLQGELSSLQKCVQNYGGTMELWLSNVDRLARFTQWSDVNEEIPCFTQCYLSEMFDFYHEQAGFDPLRVRKIFGNAVYEACRDRLQLGSQGHSSCEHAYAGFHCIISLENDPFILIENMQNATRAAKSAMKECLQQADQVEWHRMADYADFPVIEPIPCFTQCFISKLELFDQRTRRWRIPAMRQALGVPQPKAHVNSCIRKWGDNPCSTTYKQFLCFVLAN